MNDTGDPLVLKWAWYHFSLYVDHYPSIDSAVAAADGADEAPVCIEAWDDNGGYRYIGRDEMDGLMEEQYQQRQQAESERPPLVGSITLVPPPGTEGVGGRGEAGPVPWSGYATFEQLDADVERFAVMGDRLRVRRTADPHPDGRMP